MAGGKANTKKIVTEIKNKKDRLHQWIWKSPPEDEDWLKSTLRKTLRVIIIVYIEFRKDAISIRASALTYTLILSLVPMLALGTAVLKGLGAGNQIREAAYQIIHKLEVMEKHGNTENPGTDKKETMSQHLKTAVDEVLDYVEHTNFAALGAFGVVGLILAVISIFSKIEDAMNVIWMAREGRTLGRKLMDYISLIVLFPIAINIGLGAQATLNSPKLLSYVQRFIPIPLLWTLLFSLFPLLIIVATFTVFYRFLPNTDVSFKSALAGGITGGVGWLLIQVVYVKLQIGVARYNAIYGSFATIPLFLLWMHIGWVIFLTGAEVSYAVQVWKTYVPSPESITPRRSLATAYDIMISVYQGFSKRKGPSPEKIAEDVGQIGGVVLPVLEKLEKNGLLKKVKDGKEILPGAPAELVNGWEVAEIILGKDSRPTIGGTWAEKGFSAMKSTLEEINLRDMVISLEKKG